MKNNISFIEKIYLYIFIKEILIPNALKQNISSNDISLLTDVLNKVFDDIKKDLRYDEKE